MGLQEVRWDKDGTELAGDYAFLCGIWIGEHHFCTVFFVQKGIVFAIKRVEFHTK
jgi:hypothetical protein